MTDYLKVLEDDAGDRFSGRVVYRLCRGTTALPRPIYAALVAVARAAEFMNEPHERTNREEARGWVELWAASDALRQAVEEHAKGVKDG